MTISNHCQQQRSNKPERKLAQHILELATFTFLLLGSIKAHQLWDIVVVTTCSTSSCCLLSSHFFPLLQHIGGAVGKFVFVLLFALSANKVCVGLNGGLDLGVAEMDDFAIILQNTERK
jgi:hypothetical protein